MPSTLPGSNFSSFSRTCSLRTSSPFDPFLMTLDRAKHVTGEDSVHWVVAAVVDVVAGAGREALALSTKADTTTEKTAAAMMAGRHWTDQWTGAAGS